MSSPSTNYVVQSFATDDLPRSNSEGSGGVEMSEEDGRAVSLFSPPLPSSPHHGPGSVDSSTPSPPSNTVLSAEAYPSSALVPGMVTTPPATALVPAAEMGATTRSQERLMENSLEPTTSDPDAPHGVPSNLNELPILPIVPEEMLARVAQHRRRTHFSSSAASIDDLPTSGHEERFLHFLDRSARISRSSLPSSRPSSRPVSRPTSARDREWHETSFRSSGDFAEQTSDLGTGQASNFSLTPTSLVVSPHGAHKPKPFRMSTTSYDSYFSTDGEDPPDFIASLAASRRLEPDDSDLPVIRRCAILLLPIEIIRYVIDYYLAIYQHNNLRLVCRGFNLLVTSNCSLWHRRLPFLFETDDVEPTLDKCRLHNVLVGIRDGSVPLQQLTTTYCFNSCSYEAWRLNKELFYSRLEEERLVFEELSYASFVFQSQLFPTSGSSATGVVLMVIDVLLILSFFVLQQIQGVEHWVRFLPLWCLFALSYPVCYLFFSGSSIEPLVLSVIVSIGVNLTSILYYFYRVLPPTPGMPWLSCLTPTLLCIACCATYVFLLCHRWLKGNRMSTTVTCLSVLSTIAPLLLLAFLALTGAELDGSIVIPSSARGTAPEGEVAGYVRFSGFALMLVTVIIFTNCVFAIRRTGLQDLWAEEALTTVVLIGYASVVVILFILGLLTFVNVRSVYLRATTVVFFVVTGCFSVLNVAMPKNNFAYRIQLYPMVEY